MNEWGDVDYLLYFVKNNKKTKRRLKYIAIQMLLTLLFIGLELGVNGKCMKLRPSLYENMIFLYVSAIIITTLEIIIECMKIKKTHKALYRSRYISRKLLITYQTYVLITIMSLMVHLGSQMYFPAVDFHQECFYFQNELSDDYRLQATIKIILIDLFMFIELCILFMLQNVFCKNLQVLSAPRKSIEMNVYRTQSNDIIVSRSRF